MLNLAIFSSHNSFSFSRCNPKCLFYLFLFLASGPKQWWWHGCQTYCPVSSCPRTGGRGNKEQEEAEILCAQAHNLIPLGSGAGLQATACGGSWQKLGAQYCIKEKEKKIENCCADSDPHSPPSSGGAVKQRRGVAGPCSIHAKQLKHKGASPGSF